MRGLTYFDVVALIDDLREENVNLTARIAELEASLDVHKEIVVKYEEQRSEIIKLSNETVERLNSRIAELEESDKRWAGNVKVCMQLIERYESDIAELEEIDKMRSESVSTLNQANANNEDEIELLEKRIAKLKEDKNSLRDSNLWLKQNYEDLERDYGVMHEKMCARIAELEEKQRWIPVSERLPEFGTSILFYDSILERTNKGTCTALNRDKTNLQWLTDDGIYYHGNRCEYITHWKEEPARPEAESERFTVHSNIKRQDDKSSNDTQTQTIVYGKEREK